MMTYLDLIDMIVGCWICGAGYPRDGTVLDEELFKLYMTIHRRQMQWS